MSVYVKQLVRQAKESSFQLANLTSLQKNKALKAMASALLKEKSFILKENKKDIIFIVSDNGTGMNAETREKIFTLFFSSKGRKGTGLGLFISKSIIEQHGGSIQVNSKPGKGSEFIISIPQKRNDNPSSDYGERYWNVSEKSEKK